jgi:hypothetical protein
MIGGIIVSTILQDSLESRLSEQGAERISSLELPERWLHRSGPAPPLIIKHDGELWWPKKAQMYALVSNGLETSRAVDKM